MEDRLSYLSLGDYSLSSALISAVVTKILNLFSHSELLPEASCGWLNSFLSRKPFAMSNSVKKQSRSWLDSHSKPAQICSAVQKKKKSRCQPFLNTHAHHLSLSCWHQHLFGCLVSQRELIQLLLTWQNTWQKDQ